MRSESRRVLSESLASHTFAVIRVHVSLVSSESSLAFHGVIERVLRCLVFLVCLYLGLSDVSLNSIQLIGCYSALHDPREYGDDPKRP